MGLVSDMVPRFQSKKLGFLMALSFSIPVMRSVALAAAAVVSMSISVSAHAYSQLVVFGDSLSDNGNANALMQSSFGVTLPAAPYFNGRFSNGPVAVEVMAASLGLNLVDYAYGGATTGLNSRITQLNSVMPTGMKGQVNSFTAGLSAAGKTADASALYVVWGGGNDFFTTPTVQTAMIAISNLTGEVAQLYAAGARDFFIPLLPDLAYTAESIKNGGAYQQGAHQLSVGFNNGLTASLNNLESKLAGANIQIFDTNSVLTTYRNQLAAAGGNVSDPCWTGGYLGGAATLCNNPNQYMLWDGVHPTAGVHAAVGQAMAAAVPEPEAMGLALVGLIMVGALRRRQTA